MIALYRGKSLISRIIQVINWSPYSHAAWIDPLDGTVIEAWHRGGVTHVKDISTNHTKGTEVEIYSVEGETEEYRQIIRHFLKNQIGAKYDFAGIIGFIIRKNIQRKNKWFCSELIAQAYQNANLPILNLPSNKIYPGMLVASPRLRLISGVKTT